MRPLPESDLDHIMTHTHGLWEPLRGASIFLTGGTGFVGTWLLASVLRANDEYDLGVSIVALTRNPARFRGPGARTGGPRSGASARRRHVQFRAARGTFSLRDSCRDRTVIRADDADALSALLMRTSGAREGYSNLRARMARVGFCSRVQGRSTAPSQRH